MRQFIFSFDHTQAVFLTLTCVLIVTDYACGVIKALKNRNFKSSEMRSGLFKKFSYIICMFLAWLMEITTDNLNLGFRWQVFVPVCIVIILIEFSSIIENLIEINPQLKDSSIVKDLEVVKQLQNVNNGRNDDNDDDNGRSEQ